MMNESFHEFSHMHRFINLHVSPRSAASEGLNHGGSSQSSDAGPPSSQPRPLAFLGDTEAFLSRPRDVIILVDLGSNLGGV